MSSNPEAEILTPENEAQPSPEALQDAQSEALLQALKQVDEYKDLLQRERAEFSNFRKRTEREKEEMRARIAGDTLVKVLPVLDDFERALEALPAEAKQSDWLKGVEMIQRKLASIIEAEGVQTLNPLGEDFDPTLHEALGTDEASEAYPSGKVSAVLQRGYKKGERVLRPALVRVAQ
jgi:molecular chaperone GrpE